MKPLVRAQATARSHTLLQIIVCRCDAVNKQWHDWQQYLCATQGDGLKHSHLTTPFHVQLVLGVLQHKLRAMHVYLAQELVLAISQPIHFSVREQPRQTRQQCVVEAPKINRQLHNGVEPLVKELQAFLHQTFHL